MDGGLGPLYFRNALTCLPPLPQPTKQGALSAVSTPWAKNMTGKVSVATVEA